MVEIGPMAEIGEMIFVDIRILDIGGYLFLFFRD
jgi:hypothetical protein